LDLKGYLEQAKEEIKAEKMKPPKIVEKVEVKVVVKEVEKKVKETKKINTEKDGKDYSHLLDLNLLTELEFDGFMRALNM